MKRFRELLRKLWAGMNGNKTILGTTLIAIITNFPLPQPYQAILLTLISLFTGASAYHHVKKGYLRIDKG